MLNYKVVYDNQRLMHEQCIKSNALMFGALAWRGYQLKSRGAIIVYALTESEDSFEESIDAEIGYLSSEEAIQNYPKRLELFRFMDEYDPFNAIVVTFVNTEKSLVDSYHMTLAFPPPKCYALLKSQLSMKAKV